METRVAVISIIVEDRNAAEAINQLLHVYGKYILSLIHILKYSSHVGRSITYSPNYKKLLPNTDLPAAPYDRPSVDLNL